MMTNFAGYVASTLVLATFTTSDMRLLRVIGIFSNVAFITYAVLSGLLPVLVLHLLLLPVNVLRLLQLTMPTRAMPYAPAQAAHFGR